MDVGYFSAMNQDSFTYSYKTGSGMDKWSAFQGFVYAPQVDEEPSNCWMDNMEVTLLNNQRSLPLLSLDGTNPKNCTWTVHVPDGMHLKISIPAMNGYQLRIHPDGSEEYISLVGKDVQYISGKSFKIVYFSNMMSSSELPGILALVSATMQASPMMMEAQGKEIKLDDTHSIITFSDTEKGYENSHVRSFKTDK